MPLGREIIYGIRTGPGRDSVTALFCIECDTNGWFRWSGSSFEDGLHRAGEQIAVGTYDKDERLDLFTMPLAAPYVFIALCLAHAQSCGALQGQLKIVGTLSKQRHGLLVDHVAVRSVKENGVWP